MTLLPGSATLSPLWKPEILNLRAPSTILPTRNLDYPPLMVPKHGHAPGIPAQDRPLALEIRECTASIHAALAQQTPQAQIDALYLTLAHKKRLLCANILQDQNLAFLNYNHSGILSFTMRGPTLNEAWSCLCKVAGKLSKCSTDHPPSFHCL